MFTMSKKWAGHDRVVPGRWTRSASWTARIPVSLVGSSPSHPHQGLSVLNPAALKERHQPHGEIPIGVGDDPGECIFEARGTTPPDRQMRDKAAGPQEAVSDWVSHGCFLKP